VAASPARTRPLIAVLSSVPLFVEAMSAAFEGIADVAAVAVDDVLAHGLVSAYSPNAVVVEGEYRDALPDLVPCVRVDLTQREVSLRRHAEWLRLDVDLSPEAIRNAVVAEIYGGEAA
jgi:hypothetical protein